MRPWLYAARTINTHGGMGLISPISSSTYRALVGEYTGYAIEFSEAAPIVALIYAEGNALVEEYQLAKRGECSASF